MSKIFLSGVILGAEMARILAEEAGVEVVDTDDLSESEIQPICPTGHEDLNLKVYVEPLENNETWRGRGKRRMPKCK